METKVTHKVRPVGTTFRYQGRKYHVIGHIQDTEKDMFVYVVRFYGKYKQWWHYEAITAQEYDDLFKIGSLREE